SSTRGWWAGARTATPRASTRRRSTAWGRWGMARTRSTSLCLSIGCRNGRRSWRSCFSRRCETSRRRRTGGGAAREARGSMSPVGQLGRAAGLVLAVGITLTTGTTPLVATAEKAGPLSTAEIRQAEERLAALGYWTGPIDGRLDEVSRAGLVAFQKVDGRK